MYRRIMHVFYGVALCGLAFVGQAHAVSLGKIDVASHLGEPFYAEVPLALDQGEVISGVFVELASPAEYRILEVFRDDSLNQVRADVKKDSRGTRVELSSDGVMEAPFFNIVLKVRYERATHFKKYPVFLDLPRAAKPAAVSRPAPTVKPVEMPKGAEAPSAAVMPAPMAATETAGGTPFAPFDGWARTGRYGPMVFGDTVTTVAQRLRVDDRFTTEQVMVALFEKNRQKFDKDNINLIKAGTYLDVPTAAEVQRIAPSQARQVLGEHEKRWKELTQQPRYAAVAEAQRTRYSKRVRIGEEASGVAAKPVEEAMPEEKTVMPMEGKPESKAPVSGGDAAALAALRAENDALQKQLAESEAKAAELAKKGGAATTEEQGAALAALRVENEALQKKLAESEAKAAELAKKGSVPPSEELAASQARNKKLEIQLARMQKDLDRAKQQVAAGEGPLLNWVSYALMGLIVLLIVIVGILMMRSGTKRPHPAVQEAEFEPAPGGYEPTFEEVKEIEVEEVPTDTNATVRMTADEFEAAMSNSIPDLTDEDTSEMEPFKEAEEEPDPNVDYLSEADVYLRYGMEDEAEKQVQMALRLRNDSKDAHIKLAEILKARGDEAGLGQAATAARAALAGEALAAYEAALATLGGGQAAASSLEDTIPPMDATLLDQGGAGEEPSFGAGAMEITGEMEAFEEPAEEAGGLDFDFSAFGAEEETAEAAEAPAAAEAEEGGFDFSDFELPEPGGEEPAVSEGALEDTGEMEAEEPVEEAGGLDFDFSAFAGEEEEPSEATIVEQAPVAAEEEEGGFDFSEFELPEPGGEEEITFEQEPVPAEAAAPAAPEEEKAADEFDFDFGELTAGMEEAEEPAEAPVAAEAPAEEDLSFDFGDVDFSAEEPSAEGEEGAGGTSTMAMDWSSDTTSGEATVPAEELSSQGGIDLEALDLELGGFDMDLSEESISDESIDEFSSTLQTNLQELSGQFEKEEKAAGEGEASAKATESGALDMDTIHEAVDRFRQSKIDEDMDFEATMRLDSLLGAMSKDDTSDGSKGDS